MRRKNNVKKKICCKYFFKINTLIELPPKRNIFPEIKKECASGGANF